MRALSAAALLAALAAPAAADTRNEISLGPYDRALHASSANAVTEDGLFGMSYGYARRFDLGLLPKLQTWATGTFAFGGAEGTTFTMQTQLDTIALTVGGRARYELHSHLAVNARVDFGSQRSSLTLREGERELSDAAWGATSTAALSLDLLAISGKGFKLGLRAELGYTVTSAVQLAPAEANDPDTIQLDMSQASYGHLDTGGKFYSLTVLSEF